MKHCRLLFLRSTPALAALLLAAAGCQSAKVANPMSNEMLGNTPEQQIGYWHTLAERSLTSNDEALHGLILYADGKDDCSSYDQRVGLLKSRKMLPASFSEPADQAVSRGSVAVALCRVLKVRGGLMLHLMPTAPRYAVRELEFAELFPPSSPNQTFSGAEFIGVVGRAEDYERASGFGVPAAQTSTAPKEPASSPSP
jgi:hypothetical protein